MLFTRIFGIIDLSNIKESLMKTDIEIAQSIELQTDCGRCEENWFG